jgi:methanogenic corrinoid protein MtbC1
MYNIKQAAARAGVSVPVLRAWERRYGIVQPVRTASGYRQFDDAAVDRIRAMRALIAQGWSPSSAAAAILAGTVAPDLDELTVPGGGVASAAAGASAALGGAPAGSGAANDAKLQADGLAERFVAAAAALDPALVDAVLDDLFSRASFERIATELLFPALQRLGEAWAAGEVSVAGEHLASSAVLRRLGLALDAAAIAGGQGSRVVVGLPPGGRHELGALAFAIAARRAGLAVSYLGADLPADDWIAAAKDADAAVIGVVTARDRSAAIEVARRLREAYPNLVIALGGRGAPAGIEPDAAMRLPEGLVDSVGMLSSQLRGSA